MKTEFVLPGEIEKRSFEIIAAELNERNIKLDNKLAPVICRAIHTTADFDYAHTLVFSEGALDKLKELIKSGASIVTDTNMALSGINKKTLATFGCEAKCLMADEAVAKMAKEAEDNACSCQHGDCCFLEQAYYLCGRKCADCANEAL